MGGIERAWSLRLAGVMWFDPPLMIADSCRFPVPAKQGDLFDVCWCGSYQTLVRSGLSQ